MGKCTFNSRCVILMICLLAALSGCNDSGSNSNIADPWKPCPLETGGAGHGAECRYVSVPLDWEAPEGQSIDLFVKRIAATGEQRGQIWLLAGGPGAGGDSMESMVNAVQALLPGLTVYLLDHRGTMRSSKLTCPQLGDQWKFEFLTYGPAELGPCFDYLQKTWGERIHQFTPTQAARDLGELIARFRHHDEPVYIFGGSYGTFWALRYLQIYPQQPTAVVLDSISAPPLADTSLYDVNTNNVGMKLLDMCAQDTECSAKLGFNPRGFAAEVMQQWSAGNHCQSLRSQGVDTPLLKWMLAGSLMTEATRVDAIAIVHRLSRCEPEDVAALACNAKLWQKFSYKNFSMPLNVHIRLSETWPRMPTVEELQAQEDQLLFSSGASVALGRIFDIHERILGRYTVGQYGYSWPDTDVPILILHGELDSMASYDNALAAAQVFNGDHQHVVSFPYAPHGALSQTPSAGRSLPCGAEIAFAFLQDPSAPLQTQCLDDLQPVRFSAPAWYENPQQYSMERFGTADLWEPGPVNCPYQ